MNILYLTGSLNVGGTEIYALTLAKAMRNKGHKVFWATIKDGTLRSEVLSHNINLKYCNLKKRTPWNFIASIIRIRKIANAQKIDVIHAIDAYSSLVVTAAILTMNRKPKFVWSNVGIGNKTYSIMKRLCEKRIDVIIAASNFIKQTMINSGFCASKIKVQFGARELSNQESLSYREDLGIVSTDFVIGVIGRVVKMKGVHILIQSLPDILKLHSNVKVVVVGDGDYLMPLRDLVNNLSLKNNVFFTGNKININRVYNTFDIVAFPTLYEALGYIPVEAMYYKKPLIASNTGGIPEIVFDYYNGLLVEPGNIKLWSRTIINLIDDITLQNKLVENGSKFYKEYLDPSVIHDKFEQLYQDK